MGQSVELFPIKIYRDVYPHAAELKETLFSKIADVFDATKDNNNVFMQDGTLCSVHQDAYLHKRFPNETKDVVEFVNAAAREYWKICNYHSELEPFVYQLWANETPKGGWVKSHLHGNNAFTGVLYVDASPEQGNIFLENPLDMVMMAQPISPNVEYPMGQEITVNTGDLIMFPGFLKHSVKPNTTDRPRLILAFNIGSRGVYWSGQWNQNEDYRNI